AGKARDLPCRDRTNLAEADLRHHSLETGAHDAAGGGAAEIVIDDLDLGPAESRQTLAHGVLQRPALAIMQDLMARGLTHVEDRPAIQMMRPDLVRHHRPPPSGSDDRCGRVRGEAAP